MFFHASVSEAGCSPWGLPSTCGCIFCSSLQTDICGHPGWARQVPLASAGEAGWAGGWALSAGLLQTVLVWDVAQLGRGREAIILAKAHSDADVQAFQVAFFDEAR